MFKAFFTSILFLTIPLSAQGSFLMGSQEQSMVINNRILAVVNGKPISVVDLLKKMDVVFYKQYPEYRNNLAARSQFYQMSWKDVLQQLIDKELITADSEELKFEVSSGDVRQEMEQMFGPKGSGGLAVA